MDREDARIVAEALLKQDVHGPEGLAHDRVARRAVADDLGAGDVLDGVPGASDVLAELRRGQGGDPAMVLAVGSQLVGGRADVPHQPGPALGDPAEREEGPLDAMPRAEVEEPARVPLDPGLVLAPPVPRTGLLESAYLEVILDVDRKRVQQDSTSPNATTSCVCL